MSQKLTRKQQAEHTARWNALEAYLATSSDPDPESLSRSYGLPLPDVLRVIRSTDNAR